MKFKKIILISLLLLAVITISAVSATDNNSTDEMASIDNIQNELGIENIDENYCSNEISNELYEESSNKSQILSYNNEEEIIAEPAMKTGWNINYWVSNSNNYVKTIFDISEQPISVTINIANSNPDYSPAGMQLHTTLKFPSGKIYDWGNLLITGAKQTGFTTSMCNEVGVYTVTVESEGYTLNGAKYTFEIRNASNEKKEETNYYANDDYEEDYYEEDDYDDYEIETYLIASTMKVKYKSNSYFKIKLYDWDYDPVKYKKIILKVWTGKKTKTYTLKTNYKGIAKFNTKKLKLGTHKVKITFKGSGRYEGDSTISKIIVKKKLTSTKTTKKSNLKTVTIKIKGPNSYFATKKLKTGDKLQTVYSKGGQYSKGVYAEVIDYDYPINTKIKKVKFFFKNKNTGKTKTKIVTKIKNGKYSSIAKTKLISGYTPYKAKVWYK